MRILRVTRVAMIHRDADITRLSKSNGSDQLCLLSVSPNNRSLFYFRRAFCCCHSSSNSPADKRHTRTVCVCARACACACVCVYIYVCFRIQYTTHYEGWLGRPRQISFIRQHEIGNTSLI